MTLFVFGHRNPDTDAICSAIAYSDFLKQTSRPDAIAACCGAPNQRTEFALRKAKLPPPRIIMDVRPEIEDVCQRNVIFARQTEVFFEVYQRMKEHGLSAIPVLDHDDKVLGIVTLLDLLELVLQGDVDPVHSREVCSNLSKVASVLDGEFQHSVKPDQTDEFVVIVGAMSAEGFTKRMKQFPADRLLVVSGDRPTIQLPALEMGVRALVITGGYELSSGLLHLAEARGVSVIVSPYDTATTTMRIKAARLIDSVVNDEFISLPAKMPVATARQQVFRTMQTVFPVVDNGKLFGVLSKSDLVNPPMPELVLVDHNELSQAVQGAEDAIISEVLDHHRLGGSLKSSNPIRFTLEPVGSTCTLVARKFRQANLEPTSGVALCMASGIISDTLFLRSPTTTDVDRDILAWLQQFCTLDLKEYATEFFEVGSALRSGEAERVVREDCKEFEEAGVKFSISQIEEIGFDLFWDRKGELVAALEQLSKENQLDFSALLVTDIASNGSLLLMSREPDGWDEINYPELEENLYELEEVVSRKKQLLPLIISLLDSAPASSR
ncbi:Cobalt-dependent inorganic pyrophosphatase [Novipirellula galeiformis]|uniref:inorganic diphosphatase n=1 Tax=Novipirellula galeiformis TaxID=2528004 RepID=A0A5C6CCI1_9BACT|nr:putative manganese-dependent inorganic diphosphatase [Novipirellula galeiformis]TWU20549.1 Cobalt-dependent inorganic pyrophosphatase [Novipirellula galeiformis]